MKSAHLNLIENNGIIQQAGCLVQSTGDSENCTPINNVSSLAGYVTSPSRYTIFVLTLLGMVG